MRTLRQRMRSNGASASGGNGSRTRLCWAKVTSVRSSGPTTTPGDVLAEVTPAHHRGELARRPRAVHTPSRTVEGICGDVGGEDADRGRRGGERLMSQHGEAVGLLPRRARSGPDAYALGPAGPRVLEQHAPVDALQLLAISQVGGLLDGDLLDQPRHQ